MVEAGGVEHKAYIIVIYSLYICGNTETPDEYRSETGQAQGERIQPCRRRRISPASEAQRLQAMDLQLLPPLH